MVVNVIADVIGVVEIEGAVVVVALGAVAAGVVSNHPDFAIRIFNIVRAVLVDVVVEP